MVIGVRGFVPSLGDERVSVGVRKGVQLPVRDPFYALFVTAILNNIGYKSSNYGQTYCGQVGLSSQVFQLLQERVARRASGSLSRRGVDAKG